MTHEHEHEHDMYMSMGFHYTASFTTFKKGIDSSCSIFIVVRFCSAQDDVLQHVFLLRSCCVSALASVALVSSWALTKQSLWLNGGVSQDVRRTKPVLMGSLL